MMYVEDRIEIKANGLGVIAVHFCFQLNEDMINACLIFLLLLVVNFYFELSFRKAKSPLSATLWVESNPNSFVYCLLHRHLLPGAM